jgi:glucose/arabinose dehydrogenase
VPGEYPPINLSLITGGLDQPTYVTHAGDGSGRLFVVERHGKVRVILRGQVQLNSFMDIDAQVGSGGREQGLLSLAFHPDFRDNRRLFVNYTNNDGNTVVAEYRATPDRSQVDLGSAKTLLTVPQPFDNHNGGQIQFGPDGYLYLGMGDGGGANDPQGNGQNPGSLLGKMLRISVDDGDSYGVPPGNPFVDRPEFRPEIWALGLRNPWRFSFDRLTGDMYAGDVGQNAYEEIDFEPAGSPGGLNYGWAVMEGAHCLREQPCDQTGFIMPIAEYGRDGGCSITGGYVYRGSRYPALGGSYFFADFCSGKIWVLRLGEPASVQLESGLNVSSFGEDEAGELYLADFQGAIYQITQ